MSRSERLLSLIEVLRRHRRPASGHVLAAELGVSLRTLYRDIASLRAQGAPIEGEAGVGYVLGHGYLLPPLVFSDEEVDALALGLRWVIRSADSPLGRAAATSFAKLAAVLPAERRSAFDAAPMLAGPRPSIQETIDLASVRAAIRSERKLRVGYVDGNGARTTRTVWPFALGIFDRTQLLVAWCELRGAVRHFDTSRIEGADLSRRSLSPFAPGAFARVAPGSPGRRAAMITLLPKPDAGSGDDADIGGRSRRSA